MPMTKRQILSALDAAPDLDIETIAEEITPDLDADSSWEEIVEMVFHMGHSIHTAMNVAIHLGRTNDQ
jgi:hypothetical protein